MMPELALLIAAIIRVESAGNDAAVGTRAEVGCLQIRPAVVRDVNRIRKGNPLFCLEDRYFRDPSIAMFRAYVEHYATAERLGREPTLQDIARIWNGGPQGYRRDVTRAYWRKVRAELIKGGSRK
jgi:hypothetical protein